MMSEVEAADQWDFESEMLIQQAKEEGKEYGFEIDKVLYSGFSSQGDGASWAGEVNVPKYIEWKLDKKESGEAIEGIPNGILEVMFWMFSGGVLDDTVKVYRLAGHYYHAYTMSADEFEQIYNLDAQDIMGQTGGPFGSTPLGELFKATNWENAHNEEKEYYGILWETILSDARDFANDIYMRLEAAYDELYLSVN
jgi:hypothetical protein